MFQQNYRRKWIRLNQSLGFTIKSYEWNKIWQGAPRFYSPLVFTLRVQTELRKTAFMLFHRLDVLKIRCHEYNVVYLLSASSRRLIELSAPPTEEKAVISLRTRDRHVEINDHREKNTNMFVPSLRTVVNHSLWAPKQLLLPAVQFTAIYFFLFAL